MAIVLRLQGLDVKAGTEDIRTFFEHLCIPDGGVYILGGSLREAFIAFTTEQDAQLAMRHTGNFLKGSKVTLHISSMAELEHKLKLLLKGKKPSPTGLIVKSPQSSPEENLLPLKRWPLDSNSASLPSSTAAPPPSTAVSYGPSSANLQPSNVHSLDSNAAFLLGVCTVLESLHSSNAGENNEAVPKVDPFQVDSTVVASNEVRKPEQTQTSRPGYVRLFGLPASVTKEDICHIFRGLKVQETIVNVMLGLRHGCLVKFANMQDAHEALCFNQHSLGSNCVEVRGATERMWTSALQERETALDVEDSVKPKQNPHSESATHRHKFISTLQNKRRSVNWFPVPSKSPKKPRTDCDSSTPMSVTMEYIVMVSNIPKNMTKTDIKELFGCPNIAHKNVLHLLDKEGNRTDTAFIIFNHTEDYDYAMNLNGCHVGPDAIEVSSITREKLRAMVAKTKPWSLNQHLKLDRKRKLIGKRKSKSVKKPGRTSSTHLDRAAKANKTPQHQFYPSPPPGMNCGPDFTPTVPSLCRLGMGGGGRGPSCRSAQPLSIGGPCRSQQMNRKASMEIITSRPLSDNVQLNKAEKALEPSVKKNVATCAIEEPVENDPEKIKTHELFNRVRSTLNKLTLVNFEQLMKQVMKLTIDTEERLTGVVDLIFEKAIFEPHFSLLYANMCRFLMGLKVQITDKLGVTVNFYKLLLNRCQKEFEKDKYDDEAFKKKQHELVAASGEEKQWLVEELEDLKDKARRHSLGLIKFICELFQLKMITAVIMHDCIVKLLQNHDEECLECLCRVWFTIGKDLDFEKAKPRMDLYFSQMEKIIMERKTTSRIRFMLQDVLDLRRNNWMLRRGGNKTMNQIHKEAELEKHREHMKVQQAAITSKCGGSGARMDGRGRGGGLGAPPQNEGWNTVPISQN